MIALDKLMPQVAIQVQDSPDVLTLDAIRRSAHDFCYRTQCWRQESDPMNGVEGVPTYDLDAPSGTDVAHLLSLQYNQVTLKPRTHEQLNRFVPGWRTLQGTPAYYARPQDDQVTLFPMPAASLDQAIVCVVALAPNVLTATSMQDDILFRYQEPIVNGALARLFLLPGRKWSNPQLANQKTTEVNQAVLSAKANALSANSSAQLHARGRKFA